MSLKVSAILPASPTHVPGNRTEKSPSRMLCKLVRIAVRSISSDVFDFPFLLPFLGRVAIASFSSGTISLTADLFMHFSGTGSAPAISSAFSAEFNSAGTRLPITNKFCLRLKIEGESLFSDHYKARDCLLLDHEAAPAHPKVFTVAGAQ